MEHLLLMKDLTDNEKLLFLNEYNSTKKSSTTGVVLCFFLGGIGAHRYYLGDMWGIAYTVLFWTWIPALIALVECFFMSKRVKTYNDNKMQEVLVKIKSLRPTEAA